MHKSDFLYDASSYHMVSHVTASMDASEPGKKKFLILGLNYLHIYWIVFREKNDIINWWKIDKVNIRR